MDPAAFTVILESNEVHGEGFKMFQIGEGNVTVQTGLRTCCADRAENHAAVSIRLINRLLMAPDFTVTEKKSRKIACSFQEGVNFCVFKIGSSIQLELDM